MTTADETRACRALYPPSDPTARIIRCHLAAGHPGEHEEADTEVTWIADGTPAQPTCGAREVGGPAVCTREPGHPPDVHKQQIGLGVLRWACGPEDDARPAEVCCVCGSADVRYHNYREQPFCWPCADGKGPHDAGPAAVADQAGETLTFDEATWRRTARHHCRAVGVRDEHSGETIEVVARTIAPLLAEVERLTRERDEVRAKVDGGEWQWGFMHDGKFYFHGSGEQARRLGRTLGRKLHRRWAAYGPVEAVGDGSGT
jgi:hypothetical protein